MRKNKNINWGLLVTFILTCFLFVFIVFRLIGLQYDNESVVLTHDPFLDLLMLLEGIYCLKMEESYP